MPSIAGQRRASQQKRAAAMLLAIPAAPHPARRYLSLDTTRRCVRRRSVRPDSSGFAVTFAHAMTALGHPRLRRSNYNTVHVRFAPKSERTVIIEIGPGLA